MSRSRVEKVHCPNCDAENHILIWESLNTKLNPKETKQLLDGTFFVFECNQCNYKTLMDYAILYHDMENMCMIYYVEKVLEMLNEIMQQENLNRYDKT